jgi:ComF family protein
LSSVRRIAGSQCSICGEAIFSPYAGLDGQGESLCGVCRGLTPAYVQAASYGSYEGGLRELIDLLKYERVRPAAHILGRMLGEAITRLAPEFGEQLPRVIPVPLHLRKLHERGFNQSQLIAQAALRMKPAALDLRLADGVLKRTRATLSERGLSRGQRRENMRGAFAIEKPVEVTGQQILLIDDVFATGTTVSECARLLRRAGATRIWVATVARTLSGEASGARVASHKEEDELAPLATAAHV